MCKLYIGKLKKNRIIILKSGHIENAQLSLLILVFIAVFSVCNHKPTIACFVKPHMGWLVVTDC